MNIERVERWRNYVNMYKNELRMIVVNDIDAYIKTFELKCRSGKYHYVDKINSYNISSLDPNYIYIFTDDEFIKHSLINEYCPNEETIITFEREPYMTTYQRKLIRINEKVSDKDIMRVNIDLKSKIDKMNESLEAEKSKRFFNIF